MFGMKAYKMIIMKRKLSFINIIHISKLF